MYSNPPMHGALIVAKILNNKENFAAWQKELKDDVANRIIKMRKLLRAELERIGAPGTWDHITNQIGMFSFTGLSTKQCEILIDKYHIYLLKSGRISMAGINEKNYKYLAESIKSAIEQAKWYENLWWFLWIDLCNFCESIHALSMNWLVYSISMNWFMQ